MSACLDITSRHTLSASLVNTAVRGCNEEQRTVGMRGGAEEDGGRRVGVGRGGGEGTFICLIVHFRPPELGKRAL